MTTKVEDRPNVLMGRMPDQYWKTRLRTGYRSLVLRQARMKMAVEYIYVSYTLHLFSRVAGAAAPKPKRCRLSGCAARCSATR